MKEQNQARNYYLYDPEKNIECKKKFCQTECFYTQQAEYAAKYSKVLTIKKEERL